jgi:hypothetical protein
MLPELGLPTYGWPELGYPIWPTTLNAPPFYIRFNYATSEVLRNTSAETKTALSMTAETKGF